MPKKIRLNILGLSYSQTQSGAYALILGEETGRRRLPVIIGAAEAQAIAVALEGVDTYRPLTHDLFYNFSKAFNIELTEVSIVKLDQGVFYSELICIRENAKIRIDSRTSDAIALAIRFKCPIFVEDDIMKRASFFLDKGGKVVPPDEITDDDFNEEEFDSMDFIKDLSLKELKDLMEETIKNEDYETASLIRDEIKTKEKEEMKGEKDNPKDGSSDEDIL